MHPAFFPTINAGLNAIAATLLVVGYVMIRWKRVTAHRRAMISAFAVSSVFLVLYVTDKIIKGGAHTAYHGPFSRLYLVVLATHVLLAMAVPVLAVLLIRWGLRGQIERHRRLAKVAWPIWMYVSVTGVLIYLMLYVFNPGPQ